MQTGARGPASGLQNLRQIVIVLSDAGGEKIGECGQSPRDIVYGFTHDGPLRGEIGSGSG